MSREGETVSFLYDHDGMRIQKVVERDWYPTITSYTLHGELISHMAIDYTDFETEQPMQKNLHFFYDADSRPMFVEYNGEKYAYIHNLQGDIVGILDKNGVSVVNYEYDAWGKLLNCTGTMADTLGADNPFRYRGYVYDEEPGLYHLRSRYYNPAWGRFVNADSGLYSATVLLGDNLFAYCCNDFVNKTDIGGMRSKNVTGDMPVVHDIPINPAANRAIVNRHAIDQLLANVAIAKKAVKKIAQMRRHPLERIIMTLCWFKNKVDHGSEWDYKRTKRKPKWLTEHGVEKVTVDGIEMGMEEYGNFNYGFVGTAIGIPRAILIFGSYYAHYTSYQNWNEDPHDLELIDAGIAMAERYIEEGFI